VVDGIGPVDTEDFDPAEFMDLVQHAAAHPRSRIHFRVQGEGFEGEGFESIVAVEGFYVSVTEVPGTRGQENVRMIGFDGVDRRSGFVVHINWTLFGPRGNDNAVPLPGLPKMRTRMPLQYFYNWPLQLPAHGMTSHDEFQAVDFLQEPSNISHTSFSDASQIAMHLVSRFVPDDKRVRRITVAYSVCARQVMIKPATPPKNKDAFFKGGADGADDGVVTGPACVSCGYAGEDLMRCSACRVSHYCSEACQAKNWAAHQAPCARVSALYQR
jgi:hypothetical protein